MKFLKAKKIDLANKKILEIGSSNGAFLNLLKKTKADLWGVEPSEIESQESRRKFNIAPIGRKTKELLPEQEAKYDIIFSYHILEHLNDPLSELKNIKQLLKQGGLFIGEVPATPKDSANLSPAIKKSVFDNLHLFHYNPKAISSLFKKSGFSDIKVERIELKSIVKKVYSEANIHYLHPSFEKGALTKFFSFLQATELILKSSFGFSVMKPQKLTELDSEWKGPNDWIRFIARA